MYHYINEHDRNANKYYLKEVDPSSQEDEVFALIDKPKLNQSHVGKFLAKVKVNENDPQAPDPAASKIPYQEQEYALENAVLFNKCFWMDAPPVNAPLVHKVFEVYKSHAMRRDQKKSSGIFVIPKIYEWDYISGLKRAGIGFVDEEEIDETVECQSENMRKCTPQRDIAAEKRQREKETFEKIKIPGQDGIIEKYLEMGENVNLRKIPSGCKCEWYGEHNRVLPVWDSPYPDRLEMLRQHEMNKVLAPFKTQMIHATELKEYAAITRREPKKMYTHYNISHI